LPQPPVAQHWRILIHKAVLADKLTRPTEIHVRLQEAAAEAARRGEDPGRVPSLRSIERIRKEALDAEPAVQARYTAFAWPEALEDGHLPWEASSAVLELLGWLTEQGHARPAIDEGLWYWRATLAAPGTPVELRWGVGRAMATFSRWGVPARYIELYLATRPWQSVQRAIAFEERAWPAQDEVLTSALSQPDDAMVRTLQALAGVNYPEELRQLAKRAAKGGQHGNG
jgi:hypothetical protein